MKKMIKILKRIVAIVIDLAILFMVWFFSLFSPYKYAWDETLKQMKQIDPDKVLVLKMFWIIIGVVSVFITVIKCKTNTHVLDHKNAKYFSLAFCGVILIYCVYKCVGLFTL